jgi:hypothetical protein
MQNSIITPWAPRSGWNSIFSAEERQKGSDVFHYLIDASKASKAYKAHTAQSVIRLTDATAETIVMMKMYQEKYPGLRYSDAQESILHQYVSPVKREHKVTRIEKQSQPPTRTPYAALLSIDREQHQGEHGHKKENRLNEHPRHRESTQRSAETPAQSRGSQIRKRRRHCKNCILL